MSGGAGKLGIRKCSVNATAVFAALALAALAAVPAACATSRPAPRTGTQEVRAYLGGPSRAPAAASAVDTAPAIVWRTRNVRGSVGWPAVGERITVVTSTDRYVYAIDTRTGRQLWRHRAPTTMSVGAVMGNGRVFVGAEGSEGTVRALALTNGKLRWRREVGDVGAPLAYRDSAVYVATQGGPFFALRADNGQRIWRVPNVPSISGPLVHDGRVILLTLTDTLMVIDGASGRILTRRYLGVSSAAPIALLDDSTVAIAAGSGEILAVSLPGGDVRWRVPLDDTPAGAPIVHADTVHVITNSCVLTSIPIRDPGLIRTDSIGCITKAAPLLVRDGVVVATVDGRLLYYRRTDRRVVWTRDLGSELRHPPMLLDGLLIAAPMRGAVTALR